LKKPFAAYTLSVALMLPNTCNFSVALTLPIDTLLVFAVKFIPPPAALLLAEI